MFVNIFGIRVGTRENCVEYVEAFDDSVNRVRPRLHGLEDLFK